MGEAAQWGGSSIVAMMTANLQEAHNLSRDIVQPHGWRPALRLQMAGGLPHARTNFFMKLNDLEGRSKTTQGSYPIREYG